jgi:hypothetical protein
MTEILNTFYEQFGLSIPRTSARNIITIGQGDHAIGSADSYFYTTSIGPCSAYLFRSESSRYYGLYHSFPQPDTSDHSLNQLRDFREGQYRPVHGNSSREKAHLEDHFRSMLGIAALSSIHIDTFGERFDTLLVPAERKLYIAIPALNSKFSLRAF